MTVNFAIVAMDQIVNNAAKIQYMFGGQVAVPLVIRMPGGAGHQLGAHSTPIRSRRGSPTCPGSRSCARRRHTTRRALLKTAIRDDDP